ncbi:MAG: hypothetical protein LAP61_19500 [Acidobacteriia bacterium]|nr:hypothetical protein [Terriglobia bacterium]
MVDPEIQKAIEIIDKKIQSLQQARNQLALAFGVGEQRGFISPHAQAMASAQTNLPQPIIEAPQKPRKEALADFLIKNGPMSRAEIVSKAGLPEGTISYCLSDKRFFTQLDNGDWDATEFSRRGFQLKAANGDLHYAV